MRANRVLAAAVLNVSLAVAPAVAQHATAFDIQDGRRVYEASCADCHGPDGNLIAGIDFGRGVYRRAFSDDELAATDHRRHSEHADAAESGDEPRRRRCASSSTCARWARGERRRPTAMLRRGRALFEGKGECRDCHAVRGEGSRVGPDLTRIGLAAPRGRDRALAARARSRGAAREPLL